MLKWKGLLELDPWNLSRRLSELAAREGKGRWSLWR